MTIGSPLFRRTRICISVVLSFTAASIATGLPIPASQPIPPIRSSKVNGPIELRIYTGANGAFNLYQDEGDNYNYEKGQHATVPITWSDSEGTLTIGSRAGTYVGMPDEITFNIVWVRPAHGVGGAERQADNTVVYRGSELKMTRPFQLK